MDTKEMLKQIEQEKEQLHYRLEQLTQAERALQKLVNGKLSLKQEDVKERNYNNLDAARNSILPIIKEHGPLTLRQIHKMARTKGGRPYQKHTIKCYVSALRSSREVVIGGHKYSFQPNK